MPPKKATVTEKKGKAKKVIEEDLNGDEDATDLKPTVKVKGTRRGVKKDEVVAPEAGDIIAEEPASVKAKKRGAANTGSVDEEAKPAKGRAAKRPAKKEETPEPANEEEVKPKKVRGKKAESIDDVAAAPKEEAHEPTTEEGAKPKRGRAKKEEAVAEPKPAASKGKKRGAANTPVPDEEAEAKPAKGRAAKRPAKKEETPEPTNDDEVKPRRGRAKKATTPDLSDKEQDEEVAPKKGRAKKATTPDLSDKEQDEEVAPKKGRAKKATTPDLSDKDEETEAAPKKGRAKKETKPLLNNVTTNYNGMDFNCTKANADGKTPNFKVSSWNVDGLRACVKKDCLMYIEHEDPDVFCLQETKCNESTLPQEITSLEGYKQYWASADKAGYSGVGLFSKVEPIEVTYGIDSEDHDGEGRCITAEFERFYVVTAYVPNAGRKLVTLPKRMDWNEAFKVYIKKLDEKKPVILCGDLNVAHEEIDLSNPKTNKKNAGFTQEERDGMTDFLGTGFTDTFRKFNPEETGCYTFWTYNAKSRSKNIGWRLDYFLVSERFMDTICDSVIRSEILGSDHCPITLFLNI